MDNWPLAINAPMAPNKYTLQTPPNQRCQDDTERLAANQAIIRGAGYHEVSAFAFQCFNRQYSKHRQGARRIPDWRELAIGH